MKRIQTLAVLLAGAGAAGAAHAEDRGLAVSAGLGTTGGIVEAQAQITPFVQLRGGFNYLSYGVDDTYDDIAYTGDLDLSTPAAFLDVRPFANSFILTGGAYFGDKELNLNARPTTNVEIGNQTFTPAQVGSLDAVATLEDVAPFLGLGFDTTFQGTGNFGFKLIVGAMFTGSPSVNLTSTGGTLSNDPTLQAEIAREETRLQDEVNDYEVYPVIQAGLTFRF
ncbi:hypothetical protein GC169_08655 [bacterium]|nr:hypothetical protein [bacterium]